jgi:hypothetical protein
MAFRLGNRRAERIACRSNKASTHLFQMAGYCAVFIDAEIAAGPGQTVSYLCIDIVLFTKHLTHDLEHCIVSN